MKLIEWIWNEALSYGLLTSLCFVFIAFVGARFGRFWGGKVTLSFVPPMGWKVEHTRSRGLNSYTVAEPKRLRGLLEFSQWPVPGNKAADVPRIVEQVTRNFLRQARTSTEFAIASEKYSIEQFVGEQCQGSFVTFEMAGYNTNMVQAIFVMSVGGKLWNGQFSGPLDAWRQALTVLRGVKNG